MSAVYRFDHITATHIEEWLEKYPLPGFPPQEHPWIDANMGNALRVYFDMVRECNGMPPGLMPYGRRCLKAAGHDPDLFQDAVGRLIRLWSGFVRQHHLERTIHHAGYNVVWDIVRDHKGADLIVLGTPEIIIKSTTSHSDFDTRKAARYAQTQTRSLTLSVWGSNTLTTKTVGGVFLHNPDYAIQQLRAVYDACVPWEALPV